MPGELLRYLEGPTEYSLWWIALGLTILAAVIAWCTGVFVWTLPTNRLRRIPVVRRLHARLLRRRFALSIRASRDDFRAGKLPKTQAAAAMRRTLRSFLALETGSRAQYMHVGDLVKSDLAPAAPVISALNDVQFSTTSGIDLDVIGHKAEELIRSWS
jgi:hypothetical protein